ncbi:MAG: PadR family transcriptional regulator [Candidatus Bathyarchaeia archaeon]
MASMNIVENLRRRAIKNFMDILVLTEIKKRSLSGYDVIAQIHRKFGILVSSGTVYSLLYSLERDGLIRGEWNQRKRVYKLTEKGEQNIKVITKANDEIQEFLRNISLLNATQQSATT